jgi:hypothetical protein
MYPMPQDEHLKVATLGGVVSGFWASIQWQSILSTVFMTVIGALVSFVMSLILQRYAHPKR